jgi:hypothetical protein
MKPSPHHVPGETVMPRIMLRSAAVLPAAILVVLACLGAAPASKTARPSAALGVDVSGLTPEITHPYAAWNLIQRAVFTGYELDEDTKDTVKVRVVVTVHEAPEKILGTMATVVQIEDEEDGAVSERTFEYYAQDKAGAVFELAEKVDDISKGKVVGHGGQWIAGQRGARAGLYLPAEPAVGGTFEQEIAPGVSQSRSKVTRVGISYSVPAGDCEDCLETEVTDPITKEKGTKIYCRGKGLVSDWSPSHSLTLVELELRTPPPQPEGK